ncbi:hypothetical protein OCH239_19030 [Roseivivax halodurans JCM 10272]|uniref:Amidoligase enzyme n=1 Tax=Roseivivax halodurans JCM 10272 TaxID=1449350 RepID=X7E903_9RHOB|nr:amidoligase family protein [Roseivivax halodurans]ETX11686.1 hypothetical protein OCH239_19030 [Roseivivax halodurans JCM 10272]
MAHVPELRPLPRAETAGGRPRRVGVEIEFGGLPESEVAKIVSTECGGSVEQGEEKGLVVKGSELGDVQIYLDTALLSKPGTRFEESLHDLARTVVPVEIVTSPILPEKIVELDRTLLTLQRQGATGTASGITAGFGVHFNPEIVSDELSDILPVLAMFAFCEDSLRRDMGLDLSRRMLPFVDPYPRTLLDGLAAGGLHGVGDLIDLYLERSASRNHGLDMLCVFAHLDKDRVAAKMDISSVSPRPTFHYRLPDCRIDEPDWSLALEWNRWVRIEDLAEDSGLLRELEREWKIHRASYRTMRGDWTRRVSERVGSFA